MPRWRGGESKKQQALQTKRSWGRVRLSEKAISATAVEPRPRGVPFNICSETSTIQSVPKIAII
jgi:hypothetical protein